MKIDKDLTGGRIRIRNYTRADQSFAMGMWCDEETGRYMSDPAAAFVDKAYLDAIAEMEDSPEGYYFIAEDLKTGELLATCCAFPERDGAVYDIGYCVRKDRWGQGLGTEIVTLLISWAKERGAEALTAEVAADNAASNALLKKMGFAAVREAEFKKWHMDVRLRSYLYERRL